MPKSLYFIFAINVNSLSSPSGTLSWRWDNGQILKSEKYFDSGHWHICQNHNHSIRLQFVTTHGSILCRYVQNWCVALKSKRLLKLHSDFRGDIISSGKLDGKGNCSVLAYTLLFWCHCILVKNNWYWLMLLLYSKEEVSQKIFSFYTIHTIIWALPQPSKVFGWCHILSHCNCFLN